MPGALLFFDYADLEERKFGSMLRSMLAQLLLHSVKPSLEIEKLYTTCRDGDKQPTLPMLSATLVYSLQNCGESYIVLDALDECSEKAEIMSWVRQYNTWKRPKIHLLATSRRDMNIDKTMSQLHTKGLDVSFPDKEIITYIRERLATDTELSLWSPLVKSEIEESLVSKSNGM